MSMPRTAGYFSATLLLAASLASAADKPKIHQFCGNPDLSATTGKGPPR